MVRTVPILPDENALAALPARLRQSIEPYMARLDVGTIARAYRFSAEAHRGQKRADLWLGRFLLGLTMVEAGRYPEAFGELERSQQHRGEATAIFLDDVPTLRYLSTLPYWTARAQQGLGNNAAAAENYKLFLTRRPAPDPLADDARKRLTTATPAQTGR